MDDELRNMAAWMGGMAVLAWTLSTAAVFKARWERIGFVAMCIGLTVCVLVFILAPEVFV